MNAAVVEKIDNFFSKFPQRSYRKGQILIYAHDNPTHIFRLVEGRVKQYDISYRGDEVVLNIFQPPAFFPMSYAVNKTPNVYFYETDSDVVLQSAPIDETLEFVKSSPDIVYDLLSRVYLGTDGLLGRLAHMMASSARSRVLYELMIQARRFGTADGKGAIISASESDIGSRSGLARETVNREINKLKREGIIEIRGGDIRITDMRQLTAIIGQEL